MKRLGIFLTVVLLAILIQGCMNPRTEAQTVNTPTINTPATEPLTTEPPTTEPAAQIPSTNSRIDVIGNDFIEPFKNWSWGTAVSSETQEMKIHITDPWGALRPHTGGDFYSDVTKLMFQARAAKSSGGNSVGQKVNVSFDLDGSYTESQSIELTTELKQYTVNHDRSPIVGVSWQDSTGNGLEPFYIANVYLVTDNTPLPVTQPTGKAEVTLSVNPNDAKGKINPHIYGMSFANPALANELDLPINRWGGNATTRYNWEISATNTASDWYFLNVPNGADEGVDENNLPATATFNSFIQQNIASSTEILLTAPMIGWTTNGRNDNCGFNVDKYGPQDSTEEPWRPHCGNGYKDGKPLYGSSPEDTSKGIDESFTKNWLNYINKRYGNDTVGYVALDNEPMLWNSSHRDVHPEAVSYDELRDLTYRYAPAIKSVNPNAQILGPVSWGWTAYEYSAKDIAAGDDFWNNPPDRNAHGGKPFLAWYLEQMKAYELNNGQRILDFLDIHFYPQQQNVALSDNVSASTQALRLKSTRTLWDSTYLDESWINQEVQLIPRMKQLIAQEYPETKLAITEYNWGATKHINGALAQADVLGIFGREGLDMAMYWANPETSDPVSYAFRMYRNYDGQGGKFGDVGVEAGSSQQDKVSIYAAKRSDGAITMIVVNKALKDIEIAIDIAGNSNQADVYQYSKQNLHSIEKLESRNLNDTFVLPKDSIQMIVLKN